MILSKVKAKPGSEIKLLGLEKPIEWTNFPWGLTLKFPEALKNDPDLISKYAWVLRFEPMTDTGVNSSIQTE